MSALDFGAGTGAVASGRYYTLTLPDMPNSDWALGLWVRTAHNPAASSYPTALSQAAHDPTNTGDANQGFVIQAQTGLLYMSYHGLGGVPQGVTHSGETYAGQNKLLLIQRRGANVEWYFLNKGDTVSAAYQAYAVSGTTIAQGSTRIGNSNFSSDTWNDPLGEVFCFTDRSLTFAEIQAIAAGARPTYTPIVLLPFRSGGVNEANIGSGGATYNATVVGTGYTTGTDFFSIGDTTAPVLTSPTIAVKTPTSASGTVTTDTAEGTLYYIATANSTETAAYIKANGATQAVSATGSQAVTFTGLTAGGTYYGHYVHRDVAGNDSTASNSTSITNPAVLTFTGTVPAQAGVAGQAFSWSGSALSTFFTTGYSTNSYALQSGSLTNSGLSVNSSTGVISGTCGTPGTYSITIRKNDSSNPNQTADTNLFNIVITAATDTTNPTLTGSVTPSNVTSVGATITWSAGSDNVGVVGYDYRYRIGTGTWSSWIQLGNVLTTDIGSLTSSSTYNVEVRARDAAGNTSTPAITGTFNTSSAPSGTITIPNIGPWTNTLLPDTTLPNVMVIKVSDRSVVLSLTNQVTDSQARLIITNGSLVGGTAYIVLAFNSDASQRGAWPVTAV